MAGDWIKMRCNLWDDPRVGRLCDLTRCSEATVIGGLYWLWAMADQHSTDGLINGMSLAQINRKTGIKNFGEALCEIQWIEDRGNCIVIERFDEHNGASAKKRCQTAKRVALSRSGNTEEPGNEAEGSGDETPNDLFGNAASVTGALAREEKRREEELLPVEANASTSSPGRKRPARPQAIACPYDAIFDAYEETLPELPRVRLRDDEKRRTAMRKRWSWVLSSTKADGARRATTAEEGVLWFREFFRRASLNDWLMGRKPSRDYPDFKANLDFLLRDTGWKAVIERTEVSA